MSFSLRIFIAFLIIFVIEFYFAWKVSGAIKILFPDYPRHKIKTFRRIIFLFLNIYPLFLLGSWIYSALTDQSRVSVPQGFIFDYLMVYPFWIGIFIILQSILFILPLDILKLLFFPFYKKYKKSIVPFLSKVILVMVVILVVYVPARIIYDYNSVSIRITEYKKSGLPDDLNNFKITFIADIQADRYTDNKRLERYISKVNSTNPDLVLIAGDVITSTPDYIETAANYIGKIKSKYGVYSCVGDHDNWAWREDTRKSINVITNTLEKYNVKMINNNKEVIKVNNSEIGITFITNTYVERISEGMLDSLTNGKTNYDLKIFLTHQPRNYLVDKAIEYKYDLLLAGHTHGGQITFLFPFINLSPTLFETRFVRGDFRFNDPDDAGADMLMVVNRGLGMSLIPMRYNSTPEITVIVLGKE
jgi:predicted MPP superfamily phosphohydrolase